MGLRSRTRPRRLMTAVPSTAEEPARGREGWRGEDAASLCRSPADRPKHDAVEREDRQHRAEAALAVKGLRPPAYRFDNLVFGEVDPACRPAAAGPAMFMLVSIAAEPLKSRVCPE